MFNYELFESKKLERKNVDGSRMYQTDTGELYPSVTTALGKLSEKGIARWRAAVGAEKANAISTKAARAGTAMHQVAEDYVLNDFDALAKADPIALHTFNTIRPYLDENVDTIYGVELQMYSDELRTAGTADLICNYAGKPTMLDFKTSKRPKSKDKILNYFMQAAAYSIMVKEHYDLDIEKIVILMAVHGGHPIVFEEDVADYLPMTRKFFELYHRGLL